MVLVQCSQLWLMFYMPWFRQLTMDVSTVMFHMETSFVILLRLELGT
jgi:hypothetical protein